MGHGLCPRNRPDAFRDGTGNAEDGQLRRARQNAEDQLSRGVFGLAVVLRRFAAETDFRFKKNFSSKIAEASGANGNLEIIAEVIGTFFLIRKIRSVRTGICLEKIGLARKHGARSFPIKIDLLAECDSPDGKEEEYGIYFLRWRETLDQG
jgi:hypothetical protein